jgi:hypothetical protein
MLQQDQENRRQGYDPEESVPVIGTCCKVGGPVPGIDKSYRYQESGTNEPENIKSPEPGFVAFTVYIF